MGRSRSWLPFLLAFALPAPAAVAAGLAAFVQDKDGRPLQNAVVYAVPVTGPTPPSAPTAHKVTQKNMEFIPYLTVVRKGSTAEFPNLDPATHHVRSLSPAKEFNFFLTAGKAGSAVTFDTAGAVVVYCMIHDWMRSYVYVVDTPWFAATGADGKARIDNLPPASYKVFAWHPDQGHVLQPLEQSLAVPANDTPVKFGFPFTPRKPRAPRPSSDSYTGGGGG